MFEVARIANPRQRVKTIQFRAVIQKYFVFLLSK
jgi:hypothetical protein